MCKRRGSETVLPEFAPCIGRIARQASGSFLFLPPDDSFLFTENPSLAAASRMLCVQHNDMRNSQRRTFLTTSIPVAVKWNFCRASGYITHVVRPAQRYAQQPTTYFPDHLGSGWRMQCEARSGFTTSTEQECTTVLDCSGAGARPEIARNAPPHVSSLYAVWYASENFLS